MIDYSSDCGGHEEMTRVEEELCEAEKLLKEARLRLEADIARQKAEVKKLEDTVCEILKQEAAIA